jgi:arsenate reductase (glutaredoxin)
MNGLDIPADFEFQDIKAQRITPDQLEEMQKMAGSYEALFSRRSMKYKSMGLAQKTLSEDGYRALILEEYTFLKRPVFIIENDIYIGNDKNVVLDISKKLGNLKR